MIEIVKDMFSSLNLEKQDNIILFPDLSNEVVYKRLQKPINLYAKDLQLGDILLYIDASSFANDKEGLLFTKDKIYSTKDEPILYEEIRHVGKYLNMLQLNDKEYHLNISLDNTQKIITKIKEIVSKVQELKGIDSENISYDITTNKDFTDPNNRATFVKEVISKISFDLSSKMLFHLPNLKNEKILKRINDAIASYANEIRPEDVLLLIDTSKLFGDKKGTIFTANKIYSSDFSPIDYVDITDVKRTLFGSIKINKSTIKTFITPNNSIKLTTALEFIVERFSSLQLNDKENTKTQSYKEFTKEKNHFISSINSFSENTNVKEYMLLLLTPIYLFFIYYKITNGSDSMSLIMISLIILSIYLPIQVVLKENDLALKYSSVFSNKEILKFIYPAVSLILVISFIEYSNVKYWVGFNIISAIVFALWWYITEQILNLMNKSSAKSIISIIGLFIFIAILITIEAIPTFPSEFESLSVKISIYIILIINAILSVSLYLSLLLPRYGYKFVLRIFDILYKVIYNVSNQKLDFEGVVMRVYFLALAYILIIVPILSLLSGMFSSIDSTFLSYLITITTIGLTGFGAYYQISIFVSYFVKDDLKHSRYTKFSIAGFYIFIIVSMGFMNTIDKQSRQIRYTQNSISNLIKGQNILVHHK